MYCIHISTKHTFICKEMKDENVTWPCCRQFFGDSLWSVQWLQADCVVIVMLFSVQLKSSAMCAYWQGLQRRSVWERGGKRRKNEWLRCPTNPPPSSTRESAVVPLFPWRWGWAVCSKLRTVRDVREGIMICGMGELERKWWRGDWLRWLMLFWMDAEWCAKQRKGTMCLCVAHFEWTKMNSLANKCGFDLLLVSSVLLAAE